MKRLLTLLLLLGTPIKANNIDDLLNTADMNFRLGNNDIACTLVSLALQKEKFNPELARYAKRCNLRYNIKAREPYYMYWVKPDGTVFDKPMKYQSKGICLQQIKVNTKNSSNMESYFKYICRPNDNIKKFKLSN